MEKPPPLRETCDALLTVEGICAVVDTYDPSIETGRFENIRTPVSTLGRLTKDRIINAANRHDGAALRVLLAELQTSAKRCRALLMFQYHGYATSTPDAFALLIAATREIKIAAGTSDIDQMLVRKETALAQQAYALALLERNHDFMEAIALWEESQALLAHLPVEPTNADIIIGSNHLNLALGYSRLGNKEKVIENFGALIKILTTQPSLDENLIRDTAILSICIFERLGQHVKAETLAKWALSAFEQVETDSNNPTTGLAAALTSLCPRDETGHPAPSQSYEKLKLETQKILFSALLSQGKLPEAQELLPTIEASLQRAGTHEQSHSHGEINFALAKYHRTAHAIAAATRPAIADATADMDEPLADEHSELKKQTHTHFDVAKKAFGEAGLTYHTAEVELHQMLFELESGDKPREAKERLIDALVTLQKHFGTELYRLFGIGGASDAQPTALRVAIRIITMLYPAANDRESYLKFLRDFERLNAQALKAAIAAHAPEHDGAYTYADIHRTGAEVFDFDHTYIVAGGRLHDVTRPDDRATSITDLHGLQQELLRYGQQKGWRVTSYEDVLTEIKNRRDIVALKHFFFGELLAPPFPQAVETALLTYVGDTLLIATCDPHRYHPYALREQNALRNLLGNTAAPSAPEFLRNSVMQAKIGVYAEGNEAHTLARGMAILTFLATIGAEIITRGDFIGLEDQHPVDFGEYTEPHIMAAVAVSQMRNIQPGKSLMELYLDTTLENILNEQKITTDGRPATRTEVGQVGSLAVLREYRATPALYAKLFLAIAEEGHKRGVEYHLMTASKLVREQVSNLGIPYLMLGKVVMDEATRIRAGFSPEKAQEWEKYYGLDAGVVVVDGRKAAEQCKKVLNT